MPAGTETFLIYNVTLDFTDKPTNLKFYEDIEKQQEVLLENNKYIAFNGFITWDSSDNKIRQQTYYWNWPYETGKVDENGIAEGDAEDSKFAGKTMSMNITATGTQVLANTLEGKVATTLINGELGVHDTVQDAVNTADNHNGALVTLLENQTVDGITIADTENIVLDLNGKTLTVTNSVINNGTLTITGNSGKITGATADTIINNGTFIKNGESTIESTSTDGSIAIPFRNNAGATATLNSGTIKHTNTNITADRFAIENDGTLTIAGATVESKVADSTHEGGIWNKSQVAKLTISSGTIDSSATTILNDSQVNISNNNCSLKITNGNIKSKLGVVVNNNNSGLVSITGGNIESLEQSTLFNRGNNGSIEISGGMITSNGLGTSAVVVPTGTVTITDGTLTGTAGFGVFVNGGTLTLGNQSDAVDTTKPVIIGQGQNNYGVMVHSGTFNFYDGQITGPENHSINVEPNNVPTGYRRIVMNNGNGTETSTLSNMYTITFNSGNLLYGLDDCTETGAVASVGNPRNLINYSITNGVITVTNNGIQNDGYGLTSGKVYLEEEKTYRFNCNTNGTWSTDSASGTVEAFLGKDGAYSTYIHLESTNCTFTPTLSGTYWLRLDVNKMGQTNTFSDLKITYDVATETKAYGTALGTLPTPIRDGYTFAGWYTALTGGERITETTTVTEDVTYYAHWIEE